MCQQQHHFQDNSSPGTQPHRDRGDNNTDSTPPEAFPWDVGVFDAHCHPTDAMSSIANIAGMGTRALTIMATRSQDQELVSSVAEAHGIQSRMALASTGLKRVVPAFGWHPWFSYQLYDDSLPAWEATFSPSTPSSTPSPTHSLSQKAHHYTSVLHPPPTEHFIASLPDPQPLSEFISATRARLAANALALVGEVGLDKAFRLPEAWKGTEQSTRDTSLTPGGREGRWLSPHRVTMPHQTAVLVAQLRLAGDMGRAVSVHGVQAHGVLFEALQGLWKGHEREVVSRRKQKMVAPGAEDFDSDDEDGEEEEWVGWEEQGVYDYEVEEADGSQTSKSRGKANEGPKQTGPKPYPPRICLHSFSGPVQIMKQYLNPAIPARIFFSFSVVVNLSTAGSESKFPDVIRACPDDSLLIESDLHVADGDMDDYLEQMYRKVCEIKGWSLQDGAERVRRNYEEFIFG